MSDGQDVIRFVTRAERTAEEEAKYLEQVQAECEGMLERALEQVRSRKVHGVAIAVTFADGSYGTRIPTIFRSPDRLIGAAQSLVMDIYLRASPG